MAYSQTGQPMAAMCISLGDYDNDGLLDLYISDFQGSSDHLWRNDGNGFFSEVSDSAGITVPTKTVLSFGGGFIDYDNDGWLDIFIANGHVYPEIEQASPVRLARRTDQQEAAEHQDECGDVDRYFEARAADQRISRQGDWGGKHKANDVGNDEQ